jgi:excisionase family DNA binding protein
LTKLDKHYKMLKNRRRAKIMSKELDYVTLKEAARTLSVHEQTIRNWGRQGVIQLVRLPGSRYRRVPATEIARLKAQMTQTEPQAHTGVRVEMPSGDASLITQGQKLAQAIKETLAAAELATLDETMNSLRGRSWSS